MTKPRLLAPGPVEVPPAVLEAIARPTGHHRAPDFRELLLRVRGRLAELMRVPDDVLVLTGSGTAAFEAAFLAAVPEGATVVAAHAGKFGERWAELARRFGRRVVDVAAPWGRVLEPQAVADALRAHPDAAALLLVHSETSTGVLHDVEAIAAAAREVAPDVLILVDAVTSLAAVELRPVDWGLDAVVSGSQKGVMMPPGLAFAWLSERAWAQEGTGPGFYLDLRRERARQRDGQSATTPAVNLVYGLEAALGLLLGEGLERVWARRAALNEAILAAGEAVGLERYAERPSPAVAALRDPAREAPRILAAAAARGARFGSGQDQAKPELLRPSALGWADRYDAVTVAAVLEDALRDVGRDVPHGAATGAALRSLSEAGPRAG